MAKRLTCMLMLAGVLGLLPTVSQAQAPGAQFPPGKQVSIYVATSAGGAADFTMRMVARVIGKYLPGNPTVVPRNMPGAGARKLAAYLYSQAARDGTEFGVLLRAISTDTLYSGSDGLFDVLKLNWLGNPSTVTDTCGFWHTSPVKTLEELKQREIVIPAIGSDAAEVAQTSILNKLVGTKVKVVAGYQSGGEMTLALERGEGHGRCSLSWEAIKSTYPDFITRKQFIPFVQFAMTRHKELPEIPSVMEMARNDLDRQALEAFLTPGWFGFPFAAPPGLAPQVVNLLRGALEQSIKDPEFIADANARKMDLNFVPGERLEAILKRVYGFPAPVIEHARALVKP